MISSAQVVKELADRASNAASEGKERVLITLVGIPGSGKSTTAKLVADELNSRGVPTNVVGMDGFHYTRKDLIERIGPEKAAKYRGAPYTFDALGVVELARKLAQPKNQTDISFPTFDHAVKDPVLDGGVVPATARVVILEGLYLYLTDPVWSEIMALATDTWFVDVSTDVARERLAKRHLDSGIVSTIEEGQNRADNNDLVNGVYIKEHSAPANFIIDTSEF